ncbi:hypothetical protein ABIB85_008207 [Bradyrhizobium sp. JR1.5]
MLTIIPPEPGQLERFAYEYRRNGTLNLFVRLDEQALAQGQGHRAAEEYAQCMRELVDVHYPDAACIRGVQDNLSTHSAGGLYEAFPPPSQTHSAPPRVPLHPKHASWLNMVEIEIGVLRGQCAAPKRQLRR